MNNLQVIAGISIGAIFGALLRWWLGTKFNGMYEHLYFGTFLANSIACLIMGFLLYSPLFQDMAPQAVKLALLTGFLGSLSTFSTFIAEVHSSAIIKEWFSMAVNFNLQLLIGLVMFHLGRIMGVLINVRY